jgi:hypothetical protein
MTSKFVLIFCWFLRDVSVKWEDRQGGEEKKPHNEKYQLKTNRNDFFYFFFDYLDWCVVIDDVKNIEI